MFKYFPLFGAACSCLSLNSHAETTLSQPANQKHFWYELSALYFQPWEKSVVATNKYSSVLNTYDFTSQKVCPPHFDWDWGFRVASGYFFLPPQWSFDLQWTHFSARTSQTKNTITNDAIDPNNLQGSFPIWALQSSTLSSDYISNSYLHWKLSLNLLDLNFDRMFHVRRFCFKPFVGLRSAWIKQSFTIEYAGGIFSQTFISPGNSINGQMDISMKNNYWGLGPRIGLTPSVLLGKGISIYGEGAISALMGTFRREQEGEYMGSSQFSISSRPFGLRWVLDAAGGLMYCTSLFANRYDLSVQIGYEFHDFYQQMGLERDQFHVASDNSNLSMQGVVANVRFDF